MRNVFVYYECNYGELADDCGACCNIRVFSDKKKVRSQVAKTLKIYAGTGIDEPRYAGCDRFVVDKDDLDNAGVIVNEDDRLTDEQIDILVENEFKNESCCITLFANEQENGDEYFTIHVDEMAVE